MILKVEIEVCDTWMQAHELNRCDDCCLVLDCDTCGPCVHDEMIRQVLSHGLRKADLIWWM